MEASSIDESSTTTTSDHNSKSTLPPTQVNVPLKMIPLCRMGSAGTTGTSSLIEAEMNGVEAESCRKLPSSKYKGVVPQPNGRWGAQIYEKHQRVWLGTFNHEHDAAAAYDVAAHRFRGRDAVTNFTPLSPDSAEFRFLNSRSKAEIVDMLRKHIYHDELLQICHDVVLNTSADLLGPKRDNLFEKVVTPSDVGKLNRLVIPKQHAEKHFPVPSLTTSSKGLLLNFEDVNRKVWRFRYSYWNSSQSYVLTKGWSRFVKDKGLKAGDVVIFLRSSGPDRQLYIDCKPRISTTNGPDEAVLGRPCNVRPRQMLRLFGVDICRLADAGNGKRSREVDLLALDSTSKKQMVVAAL